MKPFATLAFLIIVFNAHAQTSGWKVNRDSVKLLISDSTLDTYYPKLMNRFYAFDESLSLSDYRLIYYGWVFQRNYSAYEDVRSKETKAALEENDYTKASEIANTAWKKSPVNLRANYFKGISMYFLDSTNPVSKACFRRYGKLVQAILSTGDGLSCPTAFKVIYVDDEYELVYNYFLMGVVKGQALQMPCDLLRVSPNENFSQSEIYFDISEAFIKMNEMFKGLDQPKKKKKKKSREG